MIIFNIRYRNEWNDLWCKGKIPPETLEKQLLVMFTPLDLLCSVNLSHSCVDILTKGHHSRRTDMFTSLSLGHLPSLEGDFAGSVICITFFCPFWMQPRQFYIFTLSSVAGSHSFCRLLRVFFSHIIHHVKY